MFTNMLGAAVIAVWAATPVMSQNLYKDAMPPPVGQVIEDCNDLDLKCGPTFKETVTIYTGTTTYTKTKETSTTMTHNITSTSTFIDWIPDKTSKVGFCGDKDTVTAEGPSIVWATVTTTKHYRNYATYLTNITIPMKHDVTSTLHCAKVDPTIFPFPVPKPPQNDTQTPKPPPGDEDEEIDPSDPRIQAPVLVDQVVMDGTGAVD